MNVHLNNPHKPRNKMSRRERFKAYEDEVNYAIQLLVDRWKAISIDAQILFALHTLPKIYIVATTPETQRKILAVHFNKYLPNMRLVVGRTSIFDSDEESKRRVAVISSPVDWETWQNEIEDLLESFTVLIDAKTFIETPKGKHGQYCRWTQPLESDLTLVIKTITGRYGAKPE